MALNCPQVCFKSSLVIYRYSFTRESDFQLLVDLLPQYVILLLILITALRLSSNYEGAGEVAQQVKLCHGNLSFIPVTHEEVDGKNDYTHALKDAYIIYINKIMVVLK